jgi:TPR repeat protein
VSYVGKEACKNCHPAIYNSFIETGMGQSFGAATREKSAAQFKGHKPVFDSIKNLYYYPHWIKDSMYITEFRLKGKDTIYQRTERVDYIIGSGQHTNSHLSVMNGFVYQLPLTWYAQKQKWDLPPGFEKGRNVRFSRAIEMECMSCHNAMPTIEKGSINKFVKIPDGIDCERCHGPGGLHVWDKLQGNFVDTAHQIDYTIVNPRKLSWELQIDVCQRCHLQGNAILKPGKQFSDFKPGMKLSSMVDVFLPKYEGREDEFIMASHAQRLQQSKCFIESNKLVKKDESKSFGTLNLTCITCHNPHVSVKVTGTQIFNNACKNCHSSDACTESKEKLNLVQNNCVSCHMPKSGAIDIPHVSVHDHKIKIPVEPKKLSDIKKFVGIYCVNNVSLNNEAKAKGYLGYFEKFEGEVGSLDSANYWVQDINDLIVQTEIKVHSAYLNNDWVEVIHLARNVSVATENNYWTCYRIGQAYQNTNDYQRAQVYYERAVKLAPYNLEFENKLAIIYLLQNKFELAIAQFKNSLQQQPKQQEAWVNLGFAYANVKENKLALDCYSQALKLDPDQQQALLNRAALYHLAGEKRKAIVDLNQILLINPGQEQVKLLLKEIESE